MYLNDEELCKLPNLVVLLNSATPFNCLTSKSRIPHLDKQWCDPLSLGPDDVPESNVIRWRPNGRGRYRDIDFFIDSIAFSVPEDKREMSLAYQVGGVETAVPPVCIDGRFGSMQSVAKHLGELLENKEAPYPPAHPRHGIHLL